MFTGIVAGMGQISSLEGEDVVRMVIDFCSVPTSGLVEGASVSVDGVCLTAVDFDGSKISFDVIPETLSLTTLGAKKVGSKVNLERALKFGDELGGHLLSGHIMGLGEIVNRTQGDDHLDLEIKCPQEIMRFVQAKGYIAIDGISLTIGAVSESTFDLHLIPETLKLTTIGDKGLGQFVNIEVDSMTQSIVNTVERMMEART